MLLTAGHTRIDAICSFQYIQTTVTEPQLSSTAWIVRNRPECHHSHHGNETNYTPLDSKPAVFFQRQGDTLNSHATWEALKINWLKCTSVHYNYTASGACVTDHEAALSDTSVISPAPQLIREHILLCKLVVMLCFVSNCIVNSFGSYKALASCKKKKLLKCKVWCKPQECLMDTVLVQYVC